MIISKEVEVSIGPKNYKYYTDLGYTIPKRIDSKGRLNYVKGGTKITVKLEDLPKGAQANVRCMCEYCGKERWVPYYTLFYNNSMFLKNGQTPCLSCNARNLGKSGKIHGDNKYCEYRATAHRKGLSFELTSEEFSDLTSQPCHYCGGYSRDYRPSCRDRNGVDRVDSSKGYSVDNCVPCCLKCNFIKNDMEINSFKDYISRVYHRLCENEDQE